MEQISGVLVAGGGVVGLTLATSLAQKGVPVTVLEAAPELVKEFRASTFHPPTLEMLDALGVADQLIAEGIVSDKFQYRDRQEGLIAEFDLSLLRHDTPYPFRVQLEQYALAVMLLDKLRRTANADVRFNHRVSGATLFQNHVVVDVITPEGPLQMQTPYLIGADGATSAVRHAMGIDFVGTTYPNLFLVLFTSFEFADHIPGICDVNYVWDPKEWFMLLRSPGIWRAVFPTRPEETGQNLVSDEAIQNRLQGIVPTGKPYDVIHSNLYRVHQRVAASYRKGRALLAGDAAHVNSPLGGMGLNGGIHDAVNLADKLTNIWLYQGKDDLLDLYEAQRRRAAIESVQALTQQNAADAEESDPETRERRKSEVRRTAADPELARLFLLRTSMIESLKGTQFS